MDVIKPYRAALNVRVAADESASGMSQGEFADLIFAGIEAGRWRWDRAVATAAHGASCAQWAVVSLSSPRHGFGFAYFFVEPSGLLQLCLGGLLAEPVELPMPESEGVTGSVMAQRVGLVRPTVALADTIDYLCELARGRGLLPVPARWSLDLGMIRDQVAAVAPDIERVVCGDVADREGN